MKSQVDWLIIEGDPAAQSPLDRKPTVLIGILDRSHHGQGERRARRDAPYLRVFLCVLCVLCGSFVWRLSIVRRKRAQGKLEAGELRPEANSMDDYILKPEKIGKTRHAQNFVLRPLKGDLIESERDLLFSYFNLCSEEHLFYNAGYIDQNVWLSWCKGMDMFFKRPRVSARWEGERGSGSYYGFTPKPPNP